jgi:hypothetical protein
VPAGDNSGVNWNQASKTFWFAPGTHTLGTGQFSQIIPASNTTFVGAPGAILDGQHKNAYAFTQHASNVTVKYLTIQNFISPNDEGVVNHDSADGWTIEFDTITANKGAAMMAGANQVMEYNCLTNNGQYALNAYQGGDGITNLVFDHNEVAGNDADLVDPNCGCAGGAKFWAVRGATITNNYVHDNHSVGLWADTNNVGFDVEQNWISGNDDVGFMYEISYNARIVNNTFVRNGLVAGPGNPGFPTGAIYLSESGGDSRVSSTYSTLEVSGNVFTDNWSGVVLWENADRFCGSPANSSSGYCTLVNTGVANLSTCVSGTINSQPYYGDCRWKTQNVSVHDNTFSLTTANMPSSCTLANSCGLNGVFSNWGTYPSWSPYTGEVIENAISSGQNNHFANNSYTGPWKLMYHDQGTLISPT